MVLAAGRVANDAHDPDQEADDHHGDAQLHHRPGDGGPKDAPHVELVLVVVGQLGQDGVELAGLFADGDQLAKEGGEEIARGGQGVGQGFALVDALADGQQVAAQRAVGPIGLACPDGPHVDAGLQRRAQAAAEADQRFQGDTGGEEHDASITVSGAAAQYHFPCSR